MMALVDFRADDPALHLACDEVLLNQAEAGAWGETLRFSEIGGPVVVLGIGSEWQREIYRDRCRKKEVPVLRRSSGGASVLMARGSLNYAVVLDTQRDAALAGIRESYAWILPRIAAALSERGVAVEHAGLSDLACDNRKIGGSAQRRKRRFILHHGTLLYDLDRSLPGEFLKEPPVAPDYRAGRSHGEFMSNVGLSVKELKSAVMQAFGVRPDDGPVDVTSEIAADVEILADEKYRRKDWTYRW